MSSFVTSNKRVKLSSETSDQSGESALLKRVRKLEKHLGVANASGTVVDRVGLLEHIWGASYEGGKTIPDRLSQLENLVTRVEKLKKTCEEYIGPSDIETDNIIEYTEWLASVCLPVKSKNGFVDRVKSLEEFMAKEFGELEVK